MQEVAETKGGSLDIETARMQEVAERHRWRELEKPNECRKFRNSMRGT